MGPMIQSGWWGKGRDVVGMMMTVLLWVIPSTAMTQEVSVLANGKRLYQWYCEFCHGERAEGDGPMAQHLLVKPANLTQLQKKHEGQFPFWPVYRTIEGQEEVQGHGSGAMPIWGEVFKRQERSHDPYLQEDVVIGRILSLVYYLKSIQKQ